MNFKQLQNGLCDGFVLIKKCEVKKTKNGSSYLDLLIGDKDGEMPAKPIFDIICCVEHTRIITIKVS